MPGLGDSLDASHQYLCRADEVGPSELRRFKFGKVQIVLINTGQGYVALRDSCPHQGAPLSGGILLGTMLPSDVGVRNYGREGEILRCPWHSWEFDIWTGRSLHDPGRMRVKRYAVSVIGEDIYVATGNKSGLADGTAGLPSSTD